MRAAVPFSSAWQAAMLDAAGVTPSTPGLLIPIQNVW